MFLKPGSLGRRRARGVWPPSKPAPLVPPARDPLTVHAAAGGLAGARTVTTTNTLTGLGGTFSRLEILQLHDMTLLSRMRAIQARAGGARRQLTS